LESSEFSCPNLFTLRKLIRLKVTTEDVIQRQDAVLGYNASKKVAEKAAWKFVEENKTSFDLTVINPDVIIGPMIHPVLSHRSVNESNRFAIYNFMDGTYPSVDPVRFPDYHFVSLNINPTFEGTCLI
jgi:nucleoside-diphosphate-sugar epimerase